MKIDIRDSTLVKIRFTLMEAERNCLSKTFKSQTRKLINSLEKAMKKGGITSIDGVDL